MYTHRAIFHSHKHEELNYETFNTQEAAKLGIIDYLAFYKGRQKFSKLSYQFYCHKTSKYER